MQPKKSMFYDELESEITVSLLSAEVYAHKSMEATSDGELVMAVIDTIRLTCGIPDPTENQVSSFMERLELLATRKADKPKSENKKLTRVTRGTSYAKFLQEQDTQAILGMMTGYNLGLMKELYCSADILHVLNLIDSYTGLLMESIQSDFEACLYGFGNHYKDDKPGAVVDANTPQGAAMLQQFGIGSISSDAAKELGLVLE